MPSTYSSNLAIELIANGEQSGTWGTTTNTNLGTLIEQAISGVVTQAITDGADTTITIPNGASGVARNMYIECTGALTAARNLIVPANKKLYFIFNNTTGGYAVTVKVSGQTGVSVPNGKKMLLVMNSAGTDVVSAVNYFASLGVPTIDSDTTFSSTGQITVPVGTTGQRSGSPATGMLRYNTSLGSFEGYNGSAWGGIGGAQAGGAIVTNKTTASQSYTIASGENGYSVGPITLASGVTVTISSGQRWLIQ